MPQSKNMKRMASLTKLFCELRKPCILKRQREEYGCWLDTSIAEGCKQTGNKFDGNGKSRSDQCGEARKGNVNQRYTLKGGDNGRELEIIVDVSKVRIPQTSLQQSVFHNQKNGGRCRSWSG